MMGWTAPGLPSIVSASWRSRMRVRIKGFSSDGSTETKSPGNAPSSRIGAITKYMPGHNFMSVCNIGANPLKPAPNTSRTEH